MSSLKSKIICYLLVFSLASCSTYPNKFKCGDARGLGCTMLHEIDKQIDSGQIEEAYKTPKKCRSNKCLSINTNESKETLILKKLDRATSYGGKEKDSEKSQPNRNLYF